MTPLRHGQLPREMPEKGIYLFSEGDHDKSPRMTLGNMRANGVRAVIATCLDCRHNANVTVDPFACAVFVPDVGRPGTHQGGPEWVTRACAGCGIDSRRVSNGEQYLILVNSAFSHPVSRHWKGYWQRNS